MTRIRTRRWPLVAGAVVLALAALAWGATRPRVANHFSYALPGADGLPTYVYANGRRYQSLQVCAGADWCAVDRMQWNTRIPRCYTQSDLERMQVWPLDFHHTMFTLFGAPHPVMVAQGGSPPMQTFVIADRPNCYVTYGLEGGP